MTAKNDITGHSLITRDSKIYKDKFDTVFGKSLDCVHKSESGLCYKSDRSDTNSISAKCRKPEECPARTDKGVQND